MSSPIAAGAVGGVHERTGANPPERAPAAASIEVARDPVCGMEVAVSAGTIQVEREGERYYFCSEGCRDSFTAEGAAGAGVS